MDLFIYFVLLILALFLLHFITEWFFVPSLDSIARRFNLSSDIAGATLMAAGSSAPELFVALVSIFMAGQHQNIGIGTIVGSSLFNALVIVGVSLFLGHKVIRFRQPIVRDLIFYFLATAAIILSFWDGTVSLQESILLVALYILYLVALKKWKKWFPYGDDETVENKPGKTTRSGPGSLLARLREWTGPFTSRYYLAFLVSIGLITLLSWFLVQLAIGLSEVLGIHEVFIALTVIAVGTSVPDLMSSVIVARQGRPGMAINNAIGSNVFDILVGLGLPLMLFSMFTGFASIPVDNQEMLSSFIILSLTILFLFLVILFNKRLNRKAAGLLLSAAYVVYLVYQFVIAV
ncbi:MAG: calcium/sodium antiporter [Bacteroidales bacterium]